MKYEFTNETKKIGEVTLHRIRAIRDFYIVHTDGSDVIEAKPAIIKIAAGTLGGWIEKEDNLNQDDLSWVADEACVYGDANVRSAAVVSGEARVDGGQIAEFARVFEKAVVHDGYIGDHTKVYGEAEVTGGLISDNAQIYDHAKIRNKEGDDLEIQGFARVYGNADVFCSYGGAIYIRDETEVCGNAKVATDDDLDSIWIGGNATVTGNATITGGANIRGYALVEGFTNLKGGVYLGGNAHLNIQKAKPRRDTCIPPLAMLDQGAYITDVRECLVMSPPVRGLHRRSLTFYPTRGGGINMMIDEHENPISIMNLESLRGEIAWPYPTEVIFCADTIVAAATYAKGYFARLRLKMEKRPKLKTPSEAPGLCLPVAAELVAKQQIES